MSFTYDLSTDIGKVRLNLGDTTSGTGPKPDGANLSDEEITALLSQENNEVMRAVAACLEILSNMWSSQADSVSIGSRSESGDRARKFAERAAKLRSQFGGATVAFSAGFARNDGYALNASSSGSDYA